MRCPPIDILVGFVYIEGAGVTPRPSVCYQFSNLRIAAVIRPEIVPARIVSAKTCNLLGCAVGLCRRRFFFAISTTPFLIIIIYLRKKKARRNTAQIYLREFVYIIYLRKLK